MNLLILLFVYLGLVTDQAGQPLGYTTIYNEANPEIGTATTSSGYFEILSEKPIEGDFVISYIGYAKQVIPASEFIEHPGRTPRTVVLQEQPLALEEMVVSSKRHRNRRKMMKALLAEVWAQMQVDFTRDPIAYQVVSDVRLDQDSVPWGVEQLIARSYEQPFARPDSTDLVRFVADHRKRYMYDGLRQKADAFKHSDALNRMDRKGKRKIGYKYDLKWTVQNVDSGVVVHKCLWTWWNVRTEFRKAMRDRTRHWEVSRENEGETVLTNTEKRNILGIFKYVYYRHFILDSKTLSVKRFSQQGEVWINLPIGYKLNRDQLQFVNLLNMTDRDIERLRVKKGHASVQLNTIYRRQGGRLVKQERNLHVSALVTGSKKSTVQNIPIDVKATQRGRVLR